MTDNLVEIYKYENRIKELQTRNHQVFSLVMPVIKEYSPEAHARGVQLEADDIPDFLEVECDRQEISTVLENLIKNAIEHTNTTVRVSVAVGDGHVAFVVEDDGRGIDPVDQRALFSRFHEISSDGRHPAVTGTGLYLCHQIAAAHGGRVSCDSSRGRSTVFRLSLPSKSATGSALA